MHSHVWGSHSAKFDDDDFNSFRRIACDAQTNTHTDSVSTTLKCAKSLTTLQTKEKEDEEEQEEEVEEEEEEEEEEKKRTTTILFFNNNNDDNNNDINNNNNNKKKRVRRA